jgi:hypothetical protein
MSRRGVVTGLLYAGLAILFVVSVLAALLTLSDVVVVGLEPTRAFPYPRPDNADIVETAGAGWWPSITVVGETAPGTVETVTVAARPWLVSPLLVIALTWVVVVRRRRRPVASRPTTSSTGSDADTQPIPVTR